MHPVIHNCRWCLGFAEGEPWYGDLEKRLASGAVITVPPRSKAMPTGDHIRRERFIPSITSKYTHRTMVGRIEHNLPHEALHAFTEAILDLTQS
jgi:hypothetical protein